MNELALLQALHLKGRAPAERLAAALGASVEQVEVRARHLVGGGLCAQTDAGLKLTRAGLERLAGLLDRERARVDAPAAKAVYDAFRPLDLELKKTVTAWQLRDERTPNDHTDRGYDRRVLRRLAGLHTRAGALLERLAPLVPRLARYRVRLEEAHRRIGAGEHAYVAGPRIDSYHTVWFELHEELLGLAGAQRSDDA